MGSGQETVLHIYQLNSSPELMTGEGVTMLPMKVLRLIERAPELWTPLQIMAERDPVTALHSLMGWMVAQTVAQDLIQHYPLSRQAMEKIRWIIDTSILHDLGKLGVDEDPLVAQRILHNDRVRRPYDEKVSHTLHPLLGWWLLQGMARGAESSVEAERLTAAAQISLGHHAGLRASIPIGLRGERGGLETGNPLWFETGIWGLGYTCFRVGDIVSAMGRKRYPEDQVFTDGEILEKLQQVLNEPVTQHCFRGLAHFEHRLLTGAFRGLREIRWSFSDDQCINPGVLVLPTGQPLGIHLPGSDLPVNVRGARQLLQPMEDALAPVLM